MQAKSISGRSADELKESLNQAMDDGFRPTLAFVFCSVVHNRAALTAELDSRGMQVFGATTGGEISNREAMSQSISVLLLNPDPVAFRIRKGTYHPENEGREAEKLTHELQQEFVHPAFLLATSFRGVETLYMGEKIQQAVTRVVGNGAQVWGGGAGDDFRMQESFVFTNRWESNQGIMLMAFDTDKITVKGHAFSGLQPAGTLKTVTRASESMILEVDEHPAAEIIPRFVGVRLRDEDFNDFNPREIFLGLYRNRGNPVIRSVMGFDAASKAIIVTGDIRAGDKLRLMMPPDFDTFPQLHQEALRFREEEMPNADALLLFSCIGRLGAFGPMIGEELTAVQSVYHVPQAGFFSYGEYGRTTGGYNEFHNMTCCWVALKEN
ncbi:MAG TPA: FIST C-terminal domain-containing protein [Lacibacter sp.]|nr:FIST C-terminal domain-containing protein [Lacibacter sp.]HMO90201.1 FIST C-terminal domain-containing protein [Lacibacter sp.]